MLLCRKNTKTALLEGGFFFCIFLQNKFAKSIDNYISTGYNIDSEREITTNRKDVKHVYWLFEKSKKSRGY